MVLVNFLRSTPGRVVRVAVGVGLIAYGGTHMSLLGLVLMMIGMVPAVTGLADICLLEEVPVNRVENPGTGREKVAHSARAFGANRRRRRCST